MSGEINRVPSGLLGLLDMKARGQNPRVLRGEVQGQLELLKHFSLGTREIITGNSSNVIAGGYWSCNIVVPNTEVWLIEQYSVQRAAALAAGTTYRLAPAWRPGPSGTARLTLAPAESFNAGEFPHVTSEETFILAGPGTDLGAWVASVTLGTSVALVGAALVSRYSF